MPVDKLEWYLYVVRCRDGKLYTGIATDIDRRFAEHLSGKGAKYLRGRAPLKLVFQKKIGKRSLALKIEGLIKKLSKNKKETIVESGFDINQMLRRLKLMKSA
jgi:putative endonuclease